MVTGFLKRKLEDKKKQSKQEVHTWLRLVMTVVNLSWYRGLLRCSAQLFGLIKKVFFMFLNCLRKKAQTYKMYFGVLNEKIKINQ